MNEIKVPAGKYVIAVSGGLDSMVLLDMLMELYSGSENHEFIVAHFDHGIRTESSVDARFVEQVGAEAYGLPVEIGKANLGKDASEDVARKTRYHYLDIVAKKHSATAVITAHHQDDLIETAIINMIRGTGRLGISSLKSRPGMLRPMLGLTKAEVLTYAEKHNVQWREDPTNKDVKYLRNKVRLQLMPKFNNEQKQKLLDECLKIGKLNLSIDKLLVQYLARNSHRREQKVYNRQWFNSLPHDFALEVVHYWLNQYNVHDYTHRTIETLTLRLKATKPGKQIVVGSNSYFDLTKRSIRIEL